MIRASGSEFPEGLKVLFQGRHHLLAHPGGDTRVAIETKKQLERIGIQVDISVRADVDVSKYDIVHIFGTPWNFQYQCFLNARRYEKPVALTPLYWDESDFPALRKKQGFLSRVYRLIPLSLRARITRRKRGWMQAKLQEVRHWMKVNARPAPMPNERYQEMFSGSSVLLVSSEMEKEHLFSRFPVTTSCVVVHYAVDSVFYEPEPSWFIEKYGLKDFILFVAEFNERKNQLMAIRALRNLPAPVVFIGRPASPSYAKKCRAEADSNMHFIRDLPLAQEQLASAYAAAKVHILPSLIELPGLASLEAALADCAVVASRGGCATEYLENMVEYCDPNDIDSICNATLRALEKGPNPRLKEHVASNFTWERTAEKTLEGYKLALNIDR